MGLRKPKALEVLTREETRKLPKAWIRAEFAPGSYKADSREIDVIWSMGKKGLRSTWDGSYYEELSMDPAHVNMTRMASGNSPFADNHELRYNGNRAVLGRVMSASIDKGAGTAKIRLMDPDQLENGDASDTIRKIISGILANISVGYLVSNYDRQPDVEGEEFPTYLATDWEPTEISIVPVGFDEAAVVRSEENATDKPCVFNNKQISEERKPNQEVTMTEEEKRALELKKQEEAAKIEADKKAAAEKARNDEKLRNGEIRSIFSKLGLPSEMADKAINEDKTVDESRALAIDEKAKAEVAIRSAAITATGGKGNQDESRNRAIENALEHRSDPKIKLTEDGRMFRGLRLMELAREILNSNGIQTRGLAPMEVVTRAFNTSSDFSSILANVANKSLRNGYEQSPRTFTGWAKQAIIPDFKQVSRTQLGEAPVLEQVGESGEIKRGTMVDGKEVYSLLTYAKVMAISRQAIINDDMNAFTDIPRKFGFSAASLESDLVYGILTANAALVIDSVALFHATHANLQSSGVALGVDPIGELRKFIRVQKGLDGKRVLNLIAKFLLVPAALEQKALQMTTAITPALATSVNPWYNQLMPIVEPRLDAASATAYYLTVDPAQCDTVEYGYLEGQEGVYTESRMGFDVDGLEIKARLDFGTKALDFRGMSKNVGA